MIQESVAFCEKEKQQHNKKMPATVKKYFPLNAFMLEIKDMFQFCLQLIRTLKVIKHEWLIKSGTLFDKGRTIY